MCCLGVLVRLGRRTTGRIPPVTIWFTRPRAVSAVSDPPRDPPPSSRTRPLLSWQTIPRHVGGVDLLSERGVVYHSSDPPSLFIMVQTPLPIINFPSILLWGYGMAGSHLHPTLFFDRKAPVISCLLHLPGNAMLSFRGFWTAPGGPCGSASTVSASVPGHLSHCFPSPVGLRRNFNVSLSSSRTRAQ